MFTKCFKLFSGKKDLHEGSDKDYNAESQTSKLFLEKIINTTPVPIFIKDSKHRFIMLNDDCCAFFGIKREQLIGKTDHDFFPKQQAETCVYQDKLVFETGKEFINEESLFDVNGIEHRVIIRKACFEFLNSEKTLIATIEDVTKQREYEEWLKNAKENAEQTTKMKSEFLANMSHEIRTPMNGLLGFLHLLESSNLDDEQREILNEIQKSSDMLLNVINDVLDYSRIEADKMTIENIEMDIRDCVEDIILLASPSAQKKSIHINSLIHPNVPKLVLGDSNRLKQVLNNLVNNSVKFTQTGEIFLEVELEHQEKDFAVVNFKVSDTGVGIPQDKLDLIFESFSQADASATRQYGGSGLGLSIVKKLIKLMKGDIRVESEVGKGTVFSFTLGFNMVSPTLNEEDEGLQGKNVLSVISDKTLANVVKSYSTEFGASVITPESIDEALNLPSGDEISLLITDSKDTVEVIKSKYKDLPVIFMITAGNRNLFEKTENDSINYYFSAPIRRKKLIEGIKSVLGLNQSENKTEDVKNQPVFNRNVSDFKILLAEDNEINQKLTIKILNKFGYFCEVVSNGAEAVEAYKNGGYDIILMDCQMPVLDGYQATKEIRDYESQKGFSRIPIVAITANALNGDSEECLTAGMDDYVSKPINIDNLIEVLEKYLVVKLG